MVDRFKSYCFHKLPFGVIHPFGGQPFSGSQPRSLSVCGAFIFITHSNESIMMNTQQTFILRAALRQHGIPTKSIPLLKVIMSNPGVTNTELAASLSMTKQAVSKHVNPLEEKGIIANHHGHPLWKAWEVVNADVRQLLAPTL